MEILGQLFSGLFAFAGCFSGLPMILAVVALVDSIRVGAGWYWCLIIFGFPVIGPIAYFLVVRSPMLGARNTLLMSPGVARRLQAKRRLREIQVQLANWRGPGLLVEAGEELLVLGKYREAEAHFREAQENGAAVEDLNFGLAQSLQMQGRFADAAPFLEKLCAIEPDARLGEGPLALARSLDEGGRRDEAEAVLRRVIERRSKIEAQVRLARILLQKGESQEARQLRTEIATESAALPRYLKRRYGKWIRAAKSLRAGTRMPRPEIEGAFPPGLRLKMGLAAAAAVLMITVLGIGYVSFVASGLGGVGAQVARTEQLRTRLGAIGQQHPWTRGDNLAQVDLTSEDLDRFLRVRRGVEPGLRETARQYQRYTTQAAGLSGNPFTAARSAGAASTAWVTAQNDVVQSLAEELERERMGPEELERLVALIEWRFLRRREALVFALPDYERQDWVLASQTSQPDAELAQQNAELQKHFERAKAKAASMEERAAAAVDLSPATRQLLDRRRAELDRLDPSGLRYLINALDATLIPWEED